MVDSNKRVAIINGEPESATAMYRCDSAINCFKLLGFYVEVFGVESILTGCLDLFQICYFVRVPACSLMEALFERLRTMGVKIIADFDDLIFDANCINLINGLNYLSEIDRIQFLDNVVKYKKMVQMADVFVATTIPLANAALQFNKNVLVIKNYPVNQALLLGSTQDIPKHNLEGLTVGYYSGTLTHQADFAKCADPLFYFLKHCDIATLRIVGRFSLEDFSKINCVKSKISLFAFMSYKEMLIDLAGCDLVIAPLETGNLFCECKSELKFIEAAVMGVPVVASPTRPYLNIIKNKVNGMLAESSEQWLDCFDYLSANKNKTKAMGLAARRFVLSFYGRAAQLNDYRNLLNLIS